VDAFLFQDEPARFRLETEIFIIDPSRRTRTWSPVSKWPVPRLQFRLTLKFMSVRCREIVELPSSLIDNNYVVPKASSLVKHGMKVGLPPNSCICGTVLKLQCGFGSKCRSHSKPYRVKPVDPREHLQYLLDVRSPAPSSGCHSQIRWSPDSLVVLGRSADSPPSSSRRPRPWSCQCPRIIVGGSASAGPVAPFSSLYRLGTPSLAGLIPSYHRSCHRRGSGRVASPHLRCCRSRL